MEIQIDQEEDASADEAIGGVKEETVKKNETKKQILQKCPLCLVMFAAKGGTRFDIFKRRFEASRALEHLQALEDHRGSCCHFIA